MSDERCINQNHSKMNVAVRYCVSCGEVVNQKISKRSCSQAEHAKSRKSGSEFCVDCGENLKAAF